MDVIHCASTYSSGFVKENPRNSSVSRLLMTSLSTGDKTHLSLVNSASKLLYAFFPFCSEWMDGGMKGWIDEWMKGWMDRTHNFWFVRWFNFSSCEFCPVNCLKKRMIFDIIMTGSWVASQTFCGMFS